MSLSKEFMIAELKKLGYESIKIKGGATALERAPQGNLYYMYMRITGNRQKSVKQMKKSI